jgi:lysophospholipase L1-like esterase
MFLGLIIFSISGKSGTGKNLITDPGCEYSNSQWKKPRSWSGALSRKTDSEKAYSGRGYIELKATKKKTATKGNILLLLKTQYIGQRYTWRFHAKGKGNLRLGIMQYTSLKPKHHKYKTAWQPVTKKLTDKYQTYEWSFIVDNPEILRVYLTIELTGKNAIACMDDFSLVRSAHENVEITAKPEILIVNDNQAASSVKFMLKKKNKALANKKIKIYTYNSANELQNFDIFTRNDGTAVFKLKKPANFSRLIAASADYGASKGINISVLKPKIYQQIDKIAKKIKLKKHLRILYLGDSLMDRDRGRNLDYQVNFWLNYYNPGMSDFRNSAVSGDFITRVLRRLQRMNSNKFVWRQEMYDGLFDLKYDIVFIMLGHNDTRTSSKSNYKKVFISPKLQEANYRQTIKIIRKKTKAQIVLISTTSSYFPLCKAHAERYAAKKQNHVLFGKPENLEKFNTVLQKLANEFNLDYIDVYTPTKNFSPKDTLFNPIDGLHLTSDGYTFLSKQILEYLAGKFQ